MTLDWKKKSTDPVVASLPSSFPPLPLPLGYHSSTLPLETRSSSSLPSLPWSSATWSSFNPVWCVLLPPRRASVRSASLIPPTLFPTDRIHPLQHGEFRLSTSVPISRPGELKADPATSLPLFLSEQLLVLGATRPPLFRQAFHARADLKTLLFSSIGMCFFVGGTKFAEQEVMTTAVRSRLILSRWT